MFFKNRPELSYRFNPAYENRFQDLSAYSDIIDDVKNNISFFEFYTLKEGERADQLSFRMYGTPDYYWTFYLMNDEIRYGGWPLTSSELKGVIANHYSDYVLTPGGPMGTQWPIGREVRGAFTDEVGTIVAKDFQHNTITVAGGDFGGENGISYIEGGLQVNLPIIKVTTKADSIYEYLDSNGSFVDPNQITDTTAVYAVTYREKIKQLNEDKKRIKIIKPSSINSVVTAYKRSIS